MAFITVSGETGCRTEELARAVAQSLNFELLGSAKISSLLNEEFGAPIPDKAWTAAANSVVARLGATYRLVVATPGAERLLAAIQGVLRIYLTARSPYRAGAMMLDHRVDRAAATAVLTENESLERGYRKARFGRVSPTPADFDLVLNAETMDIATQTAVVSAAARSRGILEDGLLPASAEAQIQFQSRMQLARYGITPAGKVTLSVRGFGHPSEQLFANLLDFYRIAWEYEPRSFPLQWDKDGKIVEAFTPDFYLPEFDLYVELTTMKQALVTKKNRKVKLLKAIYPHVNIQVFYQKDFQDLIFKHGLEQRGQP
jgi:cytidylate kinase